MTNERNNPWAGLASYEDPTKSERKLKFCGRDNDIYDVARLIDDNLLLILYGKSGIGKTSLLNAGVFPKLRMEQYLPVSIRLGTLEADASYPKAIIDAIERALEEIHGSVTVYNVVEEQTDDQKPERLWNFFARHRFANTEGQPIFPVVVLDQFEEVLRNASHEHVKKAQTLLNQLQYLIDENHALNDCIVDGQDYFYDFNFRFVISIREDELYLLEDNIDDLSLSMFRNCRYRLRSLSEQGATEAILVPGKDCISEEQKQAVVDRVIALSKRPQSNDIDTLLLSLVCSGTYDKKNGENITVSDLAIWKSNPMRRYYDDAILSLQDNQIRFIQKNLIKKDGTRKRIKIAEVKKALGRDTFDKLSNGSNKIFNILSNKEVELLHDQLATAIYDDREAFEERERNWKFMEMQSRFVAEKARIIVSSDSYLARLLAIEVLPKNINKPDRPYTAEAETALREACRHDTTTLIGHLSSVHSASYSHDGKRIVSASRDKTIIVWDVKSGARLKTITGFDDVVSSVSFSPDDRYILSTSWDKTIKLFDSETYSLTRIFIGHNAPILSAAFSPHGKHIVSTSSDNTIIIWDIQTGTKTDVQIDKLSEQTKQNEKVYLPVAFSQDSKHIVFALGDNSIVLWNTWTGKEELRFIGHNNKITSVSFSPNGNRIISSSYDKTIKIWSARTGKLVKMLLGHKSRVISAAFSPDNKYIVSAAYDNTIKIWNVKSGEEETTLTGHTAMIHSVAFSPDGKQVISASRDNTVRMWESYLYFTHSDSKNKDFNAVKEQILQYDNKTIKTQANDVLIFEISSGEVLAFLKGHSRKVESASFSPNGKYLVSVAHDGIIKIWDVTSYSLLWSFYAHSKRIKSVCFSSDGRHIIATTFRGEVKTWKFPLPLQDLIDQTRERFKDRPLTDEERRMYYLE